MLVRFQLALPEDRALTRLHGRVFYLEPREVKRLT
jgi:hypothetical protein